MRDKAEAFQRLARKRTGLVVDALRKITNLSNTGNYVYTAKDVDELFEYLETLVATSRAQFRPNGEKHQPIGRRGDLTLSDEAPVRETGDEKEEGETEAQ